MYLVVYIVPQIVVLVGTSFVPKGSMGEDRAGLSRIMQSGIEVNIFADSLFLAPDAKPAPRSPTDHPLAGVSRPEMLSG